MREKYFKNEYLEMWIEDGILYAVYTPYITITLDVAKINVKARLEMAEGETYPLLADVSRAKTFTKEAREYLSAGESLIGMSAGAFLIKTQIEAFLANTWLKLYKPPLPTRIFNKSEGDKAKEWLQQFKRIN